MSLPKSVYIRELGPREGFQTLNQTIPTEAKLELLEALSQTGVKEIEITSMVRPDKVPQMADAEEVLKRFQKHAGIRYTALYLNIQGFERAEATNRIENQAWLTTAASDTFLQKNSNTTHADFLKKIPEWLAAFAKAGKELHGLLISTAFGCNYEGEISTEKVISVISSAESVLAEKNTKLKEINLADTVGHGNPEQVRKLVSKVREKFPYATIALHLHDTRGTGMANVYAGLLEGVTIFDGSVGGMGGCPFAKGAAGNVPTEDVAYLCSELGIETGVDLKKYAIAARLAEKIVEHPLPGKFYKVT